MAGSSEHSHWGWGRADRFPDRAARKALGAQIETLLGFSPGGLEDPVPLDAVDLPPPRITLPEPWYSAAPETRVRHTYGRAYRDLVRGFRGDFRLAPDVVARPRNEDELEQTLALCHAKGWAVVPHGGGSSVVGGVTPDAEDRRDDRPVIALATQGLSGLHELDEVSRLARIGAGTLGPHLEHALGEHGLSLRFYPQSFEYSTLGGWVATRAGGHFATGPTRIDDLVAGVRALSPAGWSSTEVRPSSGAGPSPDRLWLGSEGAFGLIVDATVRVRKRPTHRASATIHFARFQDAVAVAKEIVQSGLRPANCRVLDEREAALNMVTTDGKAILILGFESGRLPQEDPLRRALRWAQAAGGVCHRGPVVRTGDDHRATDGASAWRSAFIEAPYLQTNLVSLGVLADTFETVCTWARFPELHRAVVGTMVEEMRRLCGSGRISCRFTHVYPDGPAPYYTFLCPVRAGSEVETWSRLKQAATDALRREGGSITHHHAIGRIHRPWYAEQVPKLHQQALRAVRSTLDPQGIMNPGVLLPPEA